MRYPSTPMWFNSYQLLADWVAANPDRTSIAIACGPKLTTLALPRFVTSVTILGGDGLTSLPHLPESLLILQVVNCPRLVCLSALPRSLKSLLVYGCDELVILPELPDSLETLWLWNCKALRGGLRYQRSAGSKISFEDGHDLCRSEKPRQHDSATSDCREDSCDPSEPNVPFWFREPRFPFGDEPGVDDSPYDYGCDIYAQLGQSELN
jgi:hypothetical protein